MEFITDVFSRCIVGWRASTSLETGLALDALEEAIWDRLDGDPDGLIHHSDHGSQYLNRCDTSRSAAPAFRVKRRSQTGLEPADSDDRRIERSVCR